MRIWHLSLTSFLAVVLAGCNTGLRPAEPTPVRTPIATLATGTLVAPGTLTVCADLRLWPYARVGPGGAELSPWIEGPYISVVREIARRLVMTLRVVDTPTAVIGTVLRLGGCDMAVAGIKASSEIAQGLEVMPYHEISEALLVQYSGSIDPAVIDDLCGLRIAVIDGYEEQALVAGTGGYAGHGLSAACTASHLAPITALAFLGADDAVAAVLAGDVDGFLTDSVIAYYHRSKLRRVDGVVDVTDQLVIVLRSGAGSDLKAAIDVALADLVRDGFLERTFTE
jgi:ABC-type amino acid transport substrate-binding protein